MRDVYLQAIDEKIKRIRFYKAVGKVVYGMIILTLITCLFIRIDSVMVMQADTLNKMNDLSLEIDKVNQSIDKQEKIVSRGDYTRKTTTTGEFTLTHYCDCVKCCGKSDGITATGTKATAGRTIAVDPNVIPLGSRVLIDGVTYTAEDVGGAVKGNKIDIFVNSHEEAIQKGKIKREVILL